MNDTSTPTVEPAGEAPAARAPKRLNVRSVKRRMAKISAGTDPKMVRKQTNKLAIAILTRMAADEIKNPTAVAKAFVTGFAEAGETGTEA